MNQWINVLSSGLLIEIVRYFIKDGTQDLMNSILKEDFPAQDRCYGTRALRHQTLGDYGTSFWLKMTEAKQKSLLVVAASHVFLCKTVPICCCTLMFETRLCLL